jgi:hypothetical protein
LTRSFATARASSSPPVISAMPTPAHKSTID